MQTMKILIAFAALGVLSLPAQAADESVGPVLWQPSMNVFRRFAGDAEPVYRFYSEVLGFKPLTAFDVGGNTQVMRIEVGASQLKFTGRVPNRSYVGGGVTAATGLRLWTFFFDDEAAVVGRFVSHGLPAPEFRTFAAEHRRSALVADPDGQAVELVITDRADAPDIEVGFVVSEIDRSLAFYRDFVGLEALEPVHDERFDTTKYRFRHGSTLVTLRSFGSDLPADTGSAGIQYVVSNVDLVAKLAAEEHIVVDQPLRTLAGFSLRTIWLDDPDGITNYFAETTASRRDRDQSGGSDAR